MGRVDELWLTDFRCYATVDVSPAPGVSVIGGANGQGKTSLLEAVHWIATTRSFRGVPNRALVRADADAAVVRAKIHSGDREQLVEAELRTQGRDRVLVNRQTLRRARDLLGVLRVTVFAPDDLQLVKGGPGLRREYLDDLLVATAPRFESVRSELDKVLKHRNALLRHGVRDDSDRTTLDVFDDKLVAAAAQLVVGRLGLVDELVPALRMSYRALAPDGGEVEAHYHAEWAEGPVDRDRIDEQLRTALSVTRRHEIERRTSLVGPHRDDWHLRIGGLDARHHASQGEQRTLALAMRLAGHETVATASDDEPVLLLDDVFSELDPDRSRALVANLPRAQTLVTTAVPLPAEIRPDARFEVHDRVVERVS